MNFKKTVAIAAAAGALTALAIPAMAETTIYGSARVATFWNTQQDLYKDGATKPNTNTDFDLRNQANSRLGVKASNGDLAGEVQLGIGTAGTGTGGNTNVYTRLAYGTYKFGLGTLLVGQTYNPYWFASEQAALDDNVNNGYGSLWDGRQPQVKLTLSNGLYLAAIRAGAITPDANGGVADVKSEIPKLCVGYEGKAGNVGFGGGVVGQSTKIDKGASEGHKLVNSVMGYAHGVVTAGAVGVAANLAVGQNLKEMGFSEGGQTQDAYAYNAADNKIENTLTIVAMGQVSFTASPTLKMNAGAGYVTTDGKNAEGNKWAKADNRLAVFVNAPITLAKGVSITPEISYLDQLTENNTDKGQKNYIYGAKWQMDF